MWPFPSRALFPPPSEAWLQKASWDPEAQGWGAWSTAEKSPLGPGGGDTREEGPGGEEEEEDAGFPLSLLEREGLAPGPAPDQVTARGAPLGAGLGPPSMRPSSVCPGHVGMCWQELQATRLKLWAMEQAQGRAGAEEGTRAEAALTRQLLSPETGCLCPGTPTEKVEADHRSVYVGNVDYGGTAEELEAYFSHCGEVHRVTILCDKFSGRPKGYAYVEFAAQSSAQAAVGLDSSIFRGRVIKVLPKRTNLPGISSTDRGGLRGHPGTRAGPFPGRSLHGHVEVSPWRSPYWRAGRLWGWVRSKPRCSTRAAYVARSCRSLAVAQTPRREPRSTSQRAGHGAAPGGSKEPWTTPGSSGSARAWPSQGCPTKNF
ncbi:embryonic polyadenylate-binding protein 2 [Manis pentadactyla]|uniref:embryonic polyadenylate-binding protein 2 n=1 Tax=Manis pentadactyla TaxID=143292 RepID=UPI00255CCA40|nr:embryonic polyadenylate-binding protein 2 [Manis pentadactyla]